MKAISIILLALVIGVLFYYVVQNPLYNQQHEIIYKIDTIVKIIPQKEIEIIEAKPKIRYIRDTIIQTQPFVAQLDTILMRDTLFAQYKFPDNLMSINVKTSNDSIKLPQITIERTKYERNWYELATALGGGIILGLILGK